MGETVQPITLLLTMIRTNSHSAPFCCVLDSYFIVIIGQNIPRMKVMGHKTKPYLGKEDKNAR